MNKIFLLLIILTLAGCKKNHTEPVSGTSDSITQTQNRSKSQSVEGNLSTKEDSLKKINDEILQALKAKNYKRFAEFIHPEKGVRFSMYAFISINEDKNFSKTDFIKYQPTKTVFIWGATDGSGEAHQATINQYLRDWVFVKDFTESSYSLNHFQAGGNSLNNLKEIYPNTDFTENYIKAVGQNNEMDWNTLRFVFEEFKGKYYLVAVINDRWTI